MSYSPSRRRTLLATAAVFGAAGCSSSGPSAEETASGAPSVSQRVRARAVQDSQGLVRQYDAVLAARPGLTGLLAPLRGEVVRHAGAFGGTASASPSASASGAPSGAPSEGVSGSASGGASGGVSPAPPVDDKSALTQLAAAERALADRRAAELLTVPGELARLLASVAAAGAVHAYVLAEGAR